MTLTLTVSVSSLGSRTRKWKASSHRGDVERSQTLGKLLSSTNYRSCMYTQAQCESSVFLPWFCIQHLWGQSLLQLLDPSHSSSALVSYKELHETKSFYHQPIFKLTHITLPVFWYISEHAALLAHYSALCNTVPLKAITVLGRGKTHHIKQQIKPPRTGVCDLTGRPWARSTYTNSIAADGTTLFWYDSWEWYCRICRKQGNDITYTERVRVLKTLCAM